MISISEVVDKYPLRAYLEDLLGPPKYRRSSYDERLCPFHQDSTPSFLVWDHHCVCKAGCQINGREYGSVLDFVQEYFGINGIPAAIEALGETPVPRKIDFPTVLEKPSISWQDVWRGYRNAAEAVPYFVGRGLREETIHERKLGVRLWGHTPDGRADKMYCRRYAIPDTAFGIVRNIFLRRDDEDTRRQIRSLDWIGEAVDRLTIESGGIPPTEERLADYLFGGRFTRIPGGIHRNLVFNAERAWERVKHEDEWGWFSRDLPYLLVHEGQIDALAMEDCLGGDYGYPSIACKGAPGLGMLKGVKELIIVQDNDKDKTRRDGSVFNPGAEYARRAIEVSGRVSGVRVIRPPDGYKDADDVVMYGDAQKWMESCGIEPIRLRRIAV